MFTGLVEELGTVEAIRKFGKRDDITALQITLHAPRVAEDAAVGDSIAVNGCCLTVVNVAAVKRKPALLEFALGRETLSRTTFSRLEKRSRVNLERSLQLGDRLGGHLVSGHIDGLGRLIKRRDEDDWSSFTFLAPQRLLRQMASKSSITVDGVSLTLVTAETERFSVALIPHTLANTTLGQLKIGDAVNLETDLLAKYVERQLESRQATTP